MIYIVGDGYIKEAQAFDDVRRSLDFDMDVFLGAFFAHRLQLSLSNLVIYNMEYLHADCPLFDFGYADILRNNVVIDYSRKNVDYLKKMGIEAFYMQYGYHKSLERTVPVEKDIDVLFVGSTHHERRLEILCKLNEKCNLRVAEGVYGEELDLLIPRAKVHLNMHHADGQPLEVVRLNYLMANHGNIVSERGSDIEMDEYYESGLRFSTYENLIDSCLEALELPFDGYETIKNIPQNCKPANEWARGKLCQQ